MIYALVFAIAFIFGYFCGEVSVGRNVRDKVIHDICTRYKIECECSLCVISREPYIEMP